MTEPGLHVCSRAPRPLHCRSQQGKSQEGVGCGGSGWEWGVPIPGTGIRDAAQGEMWVWDLQNTHRRLLAWCCPVIPCRGVAGQGMWA